MQNRKVPELRFKEFTEEWEGKRIKDFIRLLDAGVSVNSEDKPAEKNELGVLKTSCVFKGYFNINENKVVLNSNEIKRLKEPVLSDTIIISRMNTPKLVGANAYVNHSFQNIFLPDRLWQAKSKKYVNMKWLAYWMSSPATRYLLSSLATGTSNSMKNITKADVFSIHLHAPQIPEQQKIALFLSKADDKIEKIEKKKELWETYKKGLIQQLFPTEGETIPKLRFPEFSGEWEEKRLGKIADVRDGTHDSPKFYSKGYPLITSKNLLKNGKLNYNDISYIQEEDFININKRSRVDIGDILFGMIGTIGNPVIVDKDGFAIKNVALIKEQSLLLNCYLINYLKSHSINKQFHRLNTGNTQKFIALGVIRNLNINLPSLPEQQKIALFLSAIDEKIGFIAKELKALKEFKKGLLQKLLTGKVRVEI